MAKQTKTTARTSPFFAACRSLFNDPIYRSIRDVADAAGGSVQHREITARAWLTAHRLTSDPEKLLREIGL